MGTHSLNFLHQMILSSTSRDCMDAGATQGAVAEHAAQARNHAGYIVQFVFFPTDHHGFC
jgi:hypothetical protein